MIAWALMQFSDILAMVMKCEGWKEMLVLNNPAQGDGVKEEQ